MRCAAPAVDAAAASERLRLRPQVLAGRTRVTTRVDTPLEGLSLGSHVRQAACGRNSLDHQHNHHRPGVQRVDLSVWHVRQGQPAPHASGHHISTHRASRKRPPVAHHIATLHACCAAGIAAGKPHEVTACQEEEEAQGPAAQPVSPRPQQVGSPASKPPVLPSSVGRAVHHRWWLLRCQSIAGSAGHSTSWAEGPPSSTPCVQGRRCCCCILRRPRRPSHACGRRRCWFRGGRRRRPAAVECPSPGTHVSPPCPTPLRGLRSRARAGGAP